MLRYEYSTAESYYFVTVVLALFLLPYTYYIVKTRSSLASSNAHNTKVCVCDRCAAVRSYGAGSASVGRWSPKTLVLAGGWLLLAYFALIIYTSKAVVKLWDPYQVLGVEENAPLSVIRKRFRTISLTEHPDKVPAARKRSAQVKYLEIQKAHKVLTNSEARENFEKYGDPDGPRSTSFGIGLPNWMMKNKAMVILGYLGILAAVPLLFAKWWYSNVKFAEKGLLRTTVTMIKESTKNKSSQRQIIDMLTASDELKDRNSIKPGQSQPLQTLITDVSKAMRKIGQGYDESKFKIEGKVPEYARKNQLLLWAFLNRVKSDNTNLNKEAMYAAQVCQKLFAYLFEQVVQQGTQDDALNVLRLMQCLCQAITPWDTPLLQLPYLTRDHCIALSKSKRKVTSLNGFAVLSVADVREVLTDLNDSQIDEIIRTAGEMPVVIIENISFTSEEGDDIAIAGDSKTQVIVQIALEGLLPHIQRTFEEKKARVEEREKDSSPVVMMRSKGRTATNPKKNKDKQSTDKNDDNNNETDQEPAHYAQPSYAPCAPYKNVDSKPSFWVLVTDGNNVFNVATFEYASRAKVRLPIPTPSKSGIYSITVHVLSDCLFGLDIEKQAKLKVQNSSVNGNAIQGKRNGSGSYNTEDGDNDISGDDSVSTKAKK